MDPLIQSKLDELSKKIDDVAQKSNQIQSPRIGQSQVLPDAIKTRHMGEPNRYFRSGLDADLPSGATIGQGVIYYFATDTNKLYVWNGSAFKSVTLT